MTLRDGDVTILGKTQYAKLHVMLGASATRVREVNA